jgi:hypothetical protein
MFCISIYINTQSFQNKLDALNEMQYDSRIRVILDADLLVHNPFLREILLELPTNDQYVPDLLLLEEVVVLGVDYRGEEEVVYNE